VKEARIAFFGNFGTHNLGNECTLQAIVHNVTARLPHADVFVICSEPAVTEQMHQLPSVPMRASYGSELPADAAHRSGDEAIARLCRKVRRLLTEVRGFLAAYRALKDTSVLVVAGTGPLSDYGESILGFPYEIFKWALIARLRGVKVRFVAVGAGPIHGALSRFFIKRALGVADYRSFRDEVSRSLLERAGMGTKDDPIVPDLAFSLPESLFRATAADAPSSKPVIGVGVMDYYGPSPDGPDAEAFHEAYLEKMADFIDWLLRGGYTVRVLIGDLTYDLAVRAAILAKLDGRGIAQRSGQLIRDEIRSVSDLLSQLASTTLVVSPRYHNLLLAAMLGKPVLSISYDPKNDALLEGIGLGEYSQPIDKLDVDLLKAQLMKLERNAPQLQRQIQQRAAQYRDAWEREYAAVLAGLPRPQAA
jgi:polysaccharide pyruvyl transferase WcaK-like protein